MLEVTLEDDAELDELLLPDTYEDQIA
jgi:hypothetical protein